jgi:hypothetical protein
VGIALTMVVGLFSFLAIAAWLALIPTETWDRWLGQAAVLGVEERRQAARKLCTRLSNGICAAALAIVLYCNWCGVGQWVLADPVHEWIYKVAQLGYIYQSWGMFGIVGPGDCKFVYQATLRDGRTIDLLSQELDAGPRESTFTWQQIPNDRWRKLHWNLLSDFGAAYRQPLAEYIVRRWNETHDEREEIVRFDMYSHSEPFRSAGAEDRYVQIILAEVVAGEEGGNFSRAVRELKDGY